MNTTYFERLQRIKLGVELPQGPKERKPIAKVSAKKKEQNKAERPLQKTLDEWFILIRSKLTGVCQCGCGEKSQKKDDMYYKFSCCHLFPKSQFVSIRTHPVNFVERAFFGGCHSQFDDTTMERWPNMADWDDIRAKFLILDPLISEEEKGLKFYGLFKNLVETNY